MTSRLLRQFAHLFPRLPDLRGRCAEVQPLGEGHRLHPEELREPDGAAVVEGGAGWSLMGRRQRRNFASFRMCHLDFNFLTEKKTAK